MICKMFYMYNNIQVGLVNVCTLLFRSTISEYTRVYVFYIKTNTITICLKTAVSLVTNSDQYKNIRGNIKKTKKQKKNCFILYTHTSTDMK